MNFTKKFIEDLRGGATLNTNLEKVCFDTGYMVSVTNNTCDDSNVTREISRIAHFARKLNGFIGIWFNDGMWYVDVSMYVSDLTTALRMGSAYDQQAVFDWVTKDCIPVVQEVTA